MTVYVPEEVYGLKRGCYHRAHMYKVTQLLLFKYCDNCLKPIVRVDRNTERICPYCKGELKNLYLLDGDGECDINISRMQ